MTYNEYILSYLTDLPSTVLIRVQVGNLAAAQPVPDGITVEEHNEYFVEYLSADGSSLLRIIWPEG